MADNLQEVLDEAGNTVELLRNSQLGTYIYPVVPAEFTNWRREQKAWRETAVLFDQTPPHGQLLHLGPRRAEAALGHGHQQLRELPAEHRQAVRADRVRTAGSSATASCSTRREDEYVYVGRAPGANWLQFHAETGGYDVDIRYDDRSPSRPYGAAVSREYYRFQIQGPNAWQIIEKLNGGAAREGEASSTWAR